MTARLSILGEDLAVEKCRRTCIEFAVMLLGLRVMCLKLEFQSIETNCLLHYASKSYIIIKILLDIVNYWFVAL